MVFYISPLARVGKGYIVWRNHIPLVNHLAKPSFKTLFTGFFHLLETNTEDYLQD